MTRLFTEIRIAARHIDADRCKEILRAFGARCQAAAITFLAVWFAYVGIAAADGFVTPLMGAGALLAGVTALNCWAAALGLSGDSEDDNLNDGQD